ncbi:MAG: DUF5076 domain-containing protein [Sphingosinicella sp.]
MSSDHPNAISLEGGDTLTEDSHEVVRVWITQNAGSSVWIAAYLLEDPRVFGYLISDTVRHAARAYAGTYGLDEDEALQAIVDGLAEELREQFGSIDTIQEGKLN